MTVGNIIENVKQCVVTASKSSRTNEVKISTKNNAKPNSQNTLSK